MVPLTHLNLSLFSNDGSDSGGDVSCGYAMAFDRVSLAPMSRGRCGHDWGGRSEGATARQESFEARQASLKLGTFLRIL